ncbi:MAG: hypothetical protein JSW02_09460 [candidate division WOR-3 bacterium]|nr:MAG: hypothetical protein JSW02_09460 [candidate division WOR-3 bacterium]
MKNNTDLKKLERKAWTSYHNDGLGDIFLGCVIMMFALAPFLSRTGLGDFWSSAVFVPFLILIYVSIVVIRKKIIIPRIGLVNFGRVRRKRLLAFNIIIFFILLISLILGVVSLRNTISQTWMHNLRFIAVVLICFGFAGYFLGFLRLYIYGLLVALSIPLGEWLYSHIGIPHHGFPMTFGITSGIMIATGIFLYIRLLQKKPAFEGA